MRQLVLALLAGLPFAAPAAAADDWRRPIPQDPQWEEKANAESLAWNRRSLGGAYDKVGKKDPRWDGPAREALEAAALFFGRQLAPRVKLEAVHAPAKRAVEAGCDDPLVLYLYARSSYAPNHSGPQELERRFATAAAAMESSAYPPLRRISALKQAALARAERKDLSPEDRKEVTRLFDTALALLPASLKEDERNYETDNLQFDLPVVAVRALRKLNGGDYQAAFDHVDALLAKAPELKAIRLQTRGNLLIPYAWEARGNGFANTVTEEGWQKFRERLAEAREALLECWELKPGDYRTANKMLTVEKGLGGDRGEMEKWFERAMQASPINKTACELKMDWLDPKWHGTQEEMLEFGRACRDTKNWRAGLPLLLADAHLRASMRREKGGQGRYMVQKEVRDDVMSVYGEYLKRFPDDNRERSRYAAYLAMCGLPMLADKQFKIVGDDLYYFRPHWPPKWMKETRERVADDTVKIETAQEKAKRDRAEREKTERAKAPPWPPPGRANSSAAGLPPATGASSSRGMVVAFACAAGTVLVVGAILVGVALMAVRTKKKPVAPRRRSRRAEDD